MLGCIDTEPNVLFCLFLTEMLGRADSVCRVIDRVGNYKILRNNGGYIVSNIKGEYKNHGHFKKLKTCYTIIRIMGKKQVPRSKYLKGSVLRISTDERYKEKVKRKLKKDKEKQVYINFGYRKG